MKKIEGRVKWFSPEKGFGFIKSGKVDNIFVHYSSIRSNGFKSLKKGQIVYFNLGRDDRGNIAKDVEIK